MSICGDRSKRAFAVVLKGDTERFRLPGQAIVPVVVGRSTRSPEPLRQPRRWTPGIGSKLVTFYPLRQTDSCHASSAKPLTPLSRSLCAGMVGELPTLWHFVRSNRRVDIRPTLVKYPPFLTHRSSPVGTRRSGG